MYEGKLVFAQLMEHPPIHTFRRIVKRRLNLMTSLYQLLQIFSLIMFERIPLDHIINGILTDQFQSDSTKELNLFN
jgi:hypothetical protein